METVSLGYAPVESICCKPVPFKSHSIGRPASSPDRSPDGNPAPIFGIVPHLSGHSKAVRTGAFQNRGSESGSESQAPFKKESLSMLPDARPVESPRGSSPCDRCGPVTQRSLRYHFSGRGPGVMESIGTICLGIFSVHIFFLDIIRLSGSSVLRSRRRLQQVAFLHSLLRCSLQHRDAVQGTPTHATAHIEA